MTGFAVLLVLLFFWAYFVGGLVGTAVPGIQPGGGRSDVEQRTPGGMMDDMTPRG